MLSQSGTLSSVSVLTLLVGQQKGHNSSQKFMFGDRPDQEKGPVKDTLGILVAATAAVFVIEEEQVEDDEDTCVYYTSNVQ